MSTADEPEPDPGEMARQMMAELKREMAELAEKYIGKATLDALKKHKETWGKQHWYIAQIKQLMWSAGRCNQALRRCKPDGEKYKQYDRTERELERLADHLAHELMAL